MLRDALHHSRPAPRAMLFLPVLLALFPAACDHPFGGDGSAPKVQLSAPAPDQVVEADSVVVEGTARHARAVERVSFRLNGGAEETVPVTPGRSVSFHFVVRGLRLGANELEVVAYDAAERAGKRKVAFSTRDVAPPALEVASPAEGALVGRDSVRIAGVARDGMRVAALGYSLDGGAEQSVPVTAGKEAPFAFTLRGLAAGEHTLVLRARDEAGNAAERTLRFTSAAAEVRITRPRADTTLAAFALQLQGEILSPVEIKRVGLSLGDGPEARISPYWASVYGSSPGSYSFSIIADSLPQGRTTVHVHAYDAGGRRVGVDSTRVTVSVPVKRYALTFLGTLRGSDSRGTELNEKGQAVGAWYDGTRHAHAFVWDGTRMIDLEQGTGWTESGAAGINEHGEVVGTFRGQSDTCTRSFHYRIGEEGAPRTLLEACDHRAHDVNDAGKVAVSAPRTDGRYGRLPFLLEGTTLHPLQEDPSAPTYTVHRVNDRDQVLAGIFENFFGVQAALLTTTTPPTKHGVCVPADLNDLGQVAIVTGCKSVMLGGNGTVAGRQVGNLGIPNPFSTANPAALNNHTQAVGVYLLSYRSGTDGKPVPVYRPFFWDDGTTYAMEVTDGDWVVDGVADLNDAGVVLAHARNTRTGQQGAVLLRPQS